MKKASLAVIFLGLVLMLTGCGPKNDTTDPLSGYNVDINIPFATAEPSNSLTTPEPTVMIGWNGETVTLTEGEYTLLEQGSIGTKVKNLQKRLIELGYMTGSATGTFDNATTLAVKRFESMYNREMTGSATALMQYYLFSDSAKIYSGNAAAATATAQTYRTLQRGDSGEDVLRLKQRLKELGYMSTASGMQFDADVENGIKAIENAYGQSRTGIATVELQKFIFSSTVKTAWQIAAEATAVPTPTPTPAPWSFYKELSKGDSGTAVTNLQNRLRELGYMTAKADGKYGDKTVEAVKAFEAMYGKQQTGVATPILQYYLFSDDAYSAYTVTATPTVTAEYTGYVMLAFGDYGDDVVILQERLKELGYLSGAVDGYFGKDTQAAVMAFESAYGRSATGVASALLQEYLFSDEAKRIETSVEEVTTVFTELSYGMYGSDVNLLQQRLKELGYFTGVVTGVYDDNTVSAVKAFEAAYNRSQTGVATEQLQTYLYSDSAKVNPATNTADNYTSLKKGDKGDNVARLQRRLIELGYLAGTVDGYYGDGTAEAVKAFEAAYGRTQTGTASASLQAELYSESALANPGTSVAYSFSTLEKGDKGDAVTDLQNRLIELGYMTGKASGTYDTATVNAVKAFQKASGLKQTGTATSALQRELFSSSAVNSTTEDEIVTVNRKAYVSVAQTYVYDSLSTDAKYKIISIGTEVTISRTRGIWAEIKDASGNKGYALLENFTYNAPSQSVDDTKTVTVNKPAVVITEKLIVFSQPSDDSSKMGTLKQGSYVTWLRTKGEWAEVQNSKGEIGYVRAVQIQAVSTEDLPTGSESIDSVATYTPLTYKSTGTDVKRLQARLKQLGYFTGEVAGNYLTKTQAAVKEFEQAIGLVPTGNATSGLQDILFSNAAPSKGAYSNSSVFEFSDLQYGQKGTAVGEMQKRLVALGYLSTSGCTFATYDEATAVAVMEVQQAMGLSSVDGIATKELQAFLMSAASQAIKR